jgi:hypothetical protein
MADDLVNGVLAAASVAIVMTTLLVAARLWIRTRMGNLGKDDGGFACCWMGFNRKLAG